MRTINAPKEISLPKTSNAGVIIEKQSNISDAFIHRTAAFALRVVNRVEFKKNQETD